ncbi:MAG: NAD-glutamate dehydrogenase [Gammaproteobacteria bacterium]|nr:NAD-glutamate dehydrogenase [Gammaproteobacteria bacterium]
MFQAPGVQNEPVIESIIDSIVQAIPRTLDADNQNALAQFIRRYFHGVPHSDLSTQLAEDLLGAAQSHWKLSQQRPADTHKLRIFNPEFATEGWQSAHTVIEIVTQDQPWLVASVQSLLRTEHLGVHLLIHPVLDIARKKEGSLINLTPQKSTGSDSERLVAESLIHVQIDRLNTSEHIGLTEKFDAMLHLLRMIHSEQPAMQDTLAMLAHGNTEHTEFVQWLAQDRFICFGSATLPTDQLADTNATGESLSVEDSDALGLLNQHHRFHWPLREQLPADALVSLSATSMPLTISKAASKSPILRDEFADILLIPNGSTVTVLLGLFASSLQYQPTQSIPFIRDRIRSAIDASERSPDSHDGEALERVLRGFPREMLLQTHPERLLEMAKGIVSLHERQQIRLFYSVDPLNRFYNCLVFIPRDTYSRELRHNIEALLLAGLSGESLDFRTEFSSNSALARLHFVVRRRPPFSHKVNWSALEARIRSAAITWHDQLLDMLRDQYDESTALTLYKKYAKGFSENYRVDYSARAAVADIEFIENTSLADGPVMSFYRNIFTDSNTVNFKLFSESNSVSLSSVIPIIENMGLRIETGHPFEISRLGDSSVWIHEFTAEYAGKGEHNASESGEYIQAAWLQIWRDSVENDGFNQLILEAGLTWREVVIVRSYCKYLLQIAVPFSQSYMIECLVSNAEIALLLIKLFNEKFDPKLTGRNIEACTQKINEAMDSVASLDEERILRSYQNLIDATLRTNYFCLNTAGEPFDYLSFKFDSGRVNDLPLPKPHVEIFVYSPMLEAIHLRGGAVARGGLRWSDRREDFRTEVLGLMKAQMVKNAVIVPVGSKGGFFVKVPPSPDRETNQQTAISCYQTFLSGLLDITDNIIDGKLVPPSNVVRYDSDDPYLVVAADKGTATFSDYANEVSHRYDFWLGDAFASGGSAGYDHKKMGITARGAWESVKRHFRSLGIDTQTESITVAGIGDMAGDVFGNGMLLSEKLKLVAAFNHQHIFIDPCPDPAISFAERSRLFDLPRSSWEDYNVDTLSKGGAIFSRAEKKLHLSTEAAQALGIENTTLTPNELISHILKAPVDLLWNGGIGTYIKSSSETHQQAADRSNDAVRIDANALHCQVIGEGGNLGLTQLARIEFAQQGGHVYTDAIDNSAGVDCSDHEVNIKILLNSVVHNQDLTVKHRDELLANMTAEVASLVLRDNYLQTQCISQVLSEAAINLDEQAQFMTHLENTERLDREIEHLPSTEDIADRMANGDGLTAPEIAVLVSYSKLVLYDELLESSLSEDPALADLLIEYFPMPLQQQYRQEILSHRLQREIICSVITNEFINRLGPTFGYRMYRELGTSAADVVSAFIAVRSIFNMPTLWAAIEALDNAVASDIQIQMNILVRGLVERATHGLLRIRSGYKTIDQVIAQYKEGIAELIQAMPDCLSSSSKKTLNQRVTFFTDAKVPAATALQVAQVVPMSSSLDIVEVSSSLNETVAHTATVYFELGRALDLQWLREEIAGLAVTSHWHVLAKAELRSDLHYQQRYLAAEIISSTNQMPSAFERVKLWSENNAGPLEKFTALMLDIKASSDVDFAMLSLAVNEVHKLLNSDRPLSGT